MVKTVAYHKNFEDEFKKVDASFKGRIIKKIEKIIDDPEVGKPMSNVRKGTREVYIPPFRLSYKYIKKEDKVVFLDFYHKDKQKT